MVVEKVMKSVRIGLMLQLIAQRQYIWLKLLGIIFHFSLFFGYCEPFIIVPKQVLFP